MQSAARLHLRLLALALTLALICVSSTSSPVLSVTADGPDIDDPDTTLLTDDNFHQFVAQDLTLVEFYAPWCGHCKALAPEYAKAATELKKVGIPLGKVDATAESALATEFDVRGYPTLKVFRNGRSFEYKGPRKADGIVAYMKKQVGPAAKVINTEAELRSLIDTDPALKYAVVLFHSDKPSQISSSFSLLSARLRDEYVFGKSSNAELKQKYGITGGDTLVAFRGDDQVVYDGKSSKTMDVENFIRAESLPLIGEYSEATSESYRSRQLPIAKLFINVDRAPHSKTMRYYTNRLKRVAEKFRNTVLITYADRKDQAQTVEHFNAQDEEHLFIIEDVADGGKQYKYDPDDYSEGAQDKKGKCKNKKKSTALDVAGWALFIDEFLAGEAREYVRSQKAPKDNLKRAVKIATGNNFQEVVEHREKDVMIEFYAPWCGHCRALEPKYDELARKLKHESGLVIAKLDATANDWDRKKYPVSGYPTIFFKPARGKPEKYEGPREVEDMMEYIKKHGKTIGKNKKKKGGKKKKKQESNRDEL